MKRLVTFTFAVLILAACAPTVRYSLSELEDFPPQIQENIRRGEIAIGMTMQQVRYAWGAPNKVIAKGADDQGQFIEEWIYAPARVLGKKVVFADGKLIKAYKRVTRSDVRDDIRKKPVSREEPTSEVSGDGQSPE